MASFALASPRSVLRLVLLAALTTTAAHAQSLYYATPQRAFAVTGSVASILDEDVDAGGPSIGGQVAATLPGGVDLGLGISRASADRPVTALSATATVYPVRSGPARFGIFVGGQRTSSGGFSLLSASAGVVGAYHIDSPTGAAVVPQVLVAATAVEQVGLQVAVGAASAVVLPVGGATRLVAEPSLSYNVDAGGATGALSVGLAVGL